MSDMTDAMDGLRRVGTLEAVGVFVLDLEFCGSCPTGVAVLEDGVATLWVLPEVTDVGVGVLASPADIGVDDREFVFSILPITS
jgi:hypothetical protein